MQGEQFEPAIERIGDPAAAEKFRFARLFDDGPVEAQGRVAVPIAMKQRYERHAWSEPGIGAVVDTLPPRSAICDPKMGAGRAIFNRCRGTLARAAAIPGIV